MHHIARAPNTAIRIEVPLYHNPIPKVEAKTKLKTIRTVSCFGYISLFSTNDQVHAAGAIDLKFKTDGAARSRATNSYPRRSRFGFLPRHCQMLNLRPRVSEHDIASPSWFLFFVDIDDDKCFVALDFEPIAFVMYHAPLFAHEYLSDYRPDMKWRSRCCDPRTEQRVGCCSNDDKDAENHCVREAREMRRPGRWLI